jgi:8-oxo-dGTP pyrophosphatase MutT (NUDIX family)
MAIGVVALDEEDHIFLVGQYRFPLNRYSWEIPEGGGPVGTDPLESAKRELLEETGLKAERWEKLLELHLSNSVSDELGILFLATGLSQHKPMPEETEQLDVKRVAFHEAFDLFERGQITDSLTVVALLKMRLLMDEKGSMKAAAGTQG